LKVLITGATGLIGRRVIERLTPDHDVVALARRDPPADLDGAEWIRQDLSRPLDPNRLPAKVDGIVHLAQSERYRDFPEGAEDVFAVNVKSTAELLEYGRRAGARAFVLASTGGTYAPSAKPIAEDAPLAVPGPYFRSKRMAELLVENYADLIGGAVLRFFFVYGLGGRMLVNRLARRIHSDEEISIEGDPGMRINPIFADDAAAAVAAALGLEKQAVVNVAGQEVVTITDLVERLAVALDREVRIRHSGEAPGDLIAETGRMQSLLGVDGDTALDDGLRSVARAIAAGAGADRSATR
jgi:nucleoside-diphosphate-sugar epimerase